MAENKAKQVLTLKEERYLIRQIKKGNTEAFRRVYDAFAYDLYNKIIFPKIPLEDVAEDILRETFLTAMEKIDRFTWQGKSIRYWLARIASNKVIDFYRKNQRASQFIQRYKETGVTPNVSEDTPESDLAQEQWKKIIKTRMGHVLNKLNPRYQKAITMRFFEERSRQECAKALEITVGTFDVVIFRALKRLKQLYLKNYGTEDV